MTKRTLNEMARTTQVSVSMTRRAERRLNARRAPFPRNPLSGTGMPSFLRSGPVPAKGCTFSYFAPKGR